MATTPAPAMSRRVIAESHFRRVFDLSPIPTWEQDYTEVLAVLAQLRSAGVTDIAGHLADNRNDLLRLVSAVRVRHANRAAIDTYSYDPQDHDGRITLSSNGSLESFSQQIEAVWDGRSELQYEYFRDPDHPGPSQCALHWNALEIHGRPDYSQVVLSIADIGARNSLTEQLQRKTAQLELLHEVNTEISSQLDLDVVLGTIVGGLKRVFTADWAELIVLDDALETVTERVVMGLDNGNADAAELLQGIPGWVLQNRITTSSPAAQSDPRNTKTALQAAIANNIGAVVVAPLTINGHTKGTLSAGFFESANVFTAADQELVGLMAAHASFAVQNAISVERIEEQIASRDRMAAAVSHELRTPLTAVAGLAQALLDDWEAMEESDRHQLVSVIAREADDAGQIVADLLLTARTELGEVTLTNQVMELGPQAESVADSLEDGHDGTIRVSGDPVIVTADPVRVRQIVRNLVTNAIRYGGENIRIQTDATETRGTIRVIDDGSGVSPEIEAALFTPFSRGSDAVAGSTGLGLNISHRLAAAMGGELEYARVSGDTVFSLHLPRA